MRRADRAPPQPGQHAPPPRGAASAATASHLAASNLANSINVVDGILTGMITPSPVPPLGLLHEGHGRYGDDLGSQSLPPPGGLRPHSSGPAGGLANPSSQLGLGGAQRGSAAANASNSADAARVTSADGGARRRGAGAGRLVGGDGGGRGRPPMPIPGRMDPTGVPDAATTSRRHVHHPARPGPAAAAAAAAAMGSTMDSSLSAYAMPGGVGGGGLGRPRDSAGPKSRFFKQSAVHVPRAPPEVGSKSHTSHWQVRAAERQQQQHPQHPHPQPHQHQQSHGEGQRGRIDSGLLEEDAMLYTTAQHDPAARPPAWPANSPFLSYSLGRVAGGGGDGAFGGGEGGAASTAASSAVPFDLGSTSSMGSEGRTLSSSAGPAARSSPPSKSSLPCSPPSTAKGSLAFVMATAAP